MWMMCQNTCIWQTSSPEYFKLAQGVFKMRTLNKNHVWSSLCVCVCVCVCVCGHVYVVYEDTNLYNDMGMT